MYLGKKQMVNRDDCINYLLVVLGLKLLHCIGYLTLCWIISSFNQQLVKVYMANIKFFFLFVFVLFAFCVYFCSFLCFYFCFFFFSWGFFLFCLLYFFFQFLFIFFVVFFLLYLLFYFFIFFLFFSFFYLFLLCSLYIFGPGYKQPYHQTCACCF